MLKTVLVQNVFKPNTIVAEEYGIKPEKGGRMLQVLFPIELISQKRTSDPKREPSWTNPISTKLWFLEKTREIFQSPIPSPSPSNLGSQFKLPSCPALLFQWLLFLDCASLLALFLQSVIKSERGRAPYGLMALAGQGWWWICAARRPHICRKPSVFGLSYDLGGHDRAGQDGIYEKPCCQRTLPPCPPWLPALCGSVIGRQAGSALDKGATQADQWSILLLLPQWPGPCPV